MDYSETPSHGELTFGQIDSFQRQYRDLRVSEEQAHEIITNHNEAYTRRDLAQRQFAKVDKMLILTIASGSLFEVGRRYLQAQTIENETAFYALASATTATLITGLLGIVLTSVNWGRGIANTIKANGNST
ncbi:hypothetical protein K8R33_02480 [archaeon]|nr:hypothetical protein [archaeon]